MFISLFFIIMLSVVLASPSTGFRELATLTKNGKSPEKIPKKSFRRDAMSHITSYKQSVPGTPLKNKKNDGHDDMTTDFNKMDITKNKQDSSGST